jgi:HTH-type transcriptional regulator / antitoxin HipB
MKSEETIDELQAFIDEQKALHPGFAEGYDEGYRHFRIGVMLKQARINAGLTQIDVAEKLKTHKSAISRIENHAEDIKLSTLTHYAEALGKKLDISIC